MQVSRPVTETRPLVRIGCDHAEPASHHHQQDCQHGPNDDHHHGLPEGATGSAVRPLVISLVIALVVLVAEVIGGLLTGSLALLADAGHLATDSAALILALVAGWLARKPATARRTFGFRRAGVIAAFVNAAALFVVAIVISWEAIGRIGQPPEIASGLMLAVAIFGLLANALMLRVLSGGEGGHSHDMNTRAARLHVLGDFLGSVGAIAAAVIMLTTGWYLADPLLSILVSVLILRGAWTIIRDATDVLLDAAPASMDTSRIGADVVAVPGISGLHDLHVWTVAPGQVSLTGHVELTGERPWPDVLADLARLLQGRFGIRHLTLQPEVIPPSGNGTGAVPAPVPCCLDGYRRGPASPLATARP